MFFISLIFPAQSEATFNEPNRTDQSGRRETFILVAQEVDEPEQTKECRNMFISSQASLFLFLFSVFLSGTDARVLHRREPVSVTRK